MKRTEDNFIMLPTVDFCFKELMKNPKVRQGFIAALLNRPPEDIEETLLLPTIMQGESETDKLGILDVRVLMKDKTQIDLEMQVAYFPYWDQRILFYLGRMYIEQLQKGEPYSKLKKCIHVSILDFIRFPNDEECYRTAHLRDDKTGELYSDLLELQILELPKLPSVSEITSPVIDWMRFLSRKSKKEFEEMAKTDPYINEAYDTLLNLSADELKKLKYDAREKALKDYNSQVLGYREDGIHQGIILAKKVLKLSSEGKSPQEISAECHISLEQIGEILD